MVERHVGSGQTYSTIAAAHAASGSGDEIVIHPGTYTEQVNHWANLIPNLTFRSSTGDAADVLWVGTGAIGNAYPLKIGVTGTGAGIWDAYVSGIQFRNGSNGGSTVQVTRSGPTRYPRAHISDCYMQTINNYTALRCSSYYCEFDRCVFEGTRASVGSGDLVGAIFSPNYFRNCLFYAGSTIACRNGNEFIHCTFAHSRSDELITDTGAGQGNYYNCVFYDWAWPSGGSEHLTDNVPATGSFTDCIAYRDNGMTSVDTGVTEDDPELEGGTTVRASYGDPLLLTDSQLQNISPALDFCSLVGGVTDDFFGNSRPQQSAYDAGFHENDYIPKTMKVVGAEAIYTP